jgi:hypothetical protein
MQSVTQENHIGRSGRNIAAAQTASTPAMWAGTVSGGLAVAFLIVDSVGKLLEVQPVIDGTRQLGYSPEVVFSLGVTLLVCVLLYLMPRTSLLGAVLLTGYLGGAVATHVRVDSPLFTHTLFPTYLAALLWAALFLRDVRLRVFLPWRHWIRS